MKFELYKWEPLKGEYLVTIKLDGVRVHQVDGKMLSRAGKELYNIPPFEGKVAEVYCGSFKKTIQAVRTKKKLTQIDPFHVYPLEPIDERLVLATIIDPQPEEIKKHFDSMLYHGHEGLVLHGPKLYKVKPYETYDVKITGVIEGKGRNKGKLGALETDMGNVGTGFTDREREMFWFDNEHLIDKIVEIKCMKLTEDGKFRHPVFIRMRYDKDK